MSGSRAGFSSRRKLGSEILQSSRSPEHCEFVTGWWLRVRERANTPELGHREHMPVFPNGERGLILVEAKAHADELHPAGKPSGNASNDGQIRSAVLEANRDLSGGLAGWALCVERNYQLCNRFAMRRGGLATLWNRLSYWSISGSLVPD